MECAVVSIGLAVVGIIAALRMAMRESSRVDLLERRVRNLENQLWAVSQRQAADAPSPRRAEPPAASEAVIFPPVPTATERHVESLGRAEAGKAAVLARVTTPETPNGG